MNKENCFYLGIILKPHGVFGNMVLKIEINFFDCLIDNLESIFIEIDEQLVPFFIAEIDYVNEETAIIGFDDIDDESKVKELVGCRLFLPDNLIPEDIEKVAELHYIIGFTVIDSRHGEIGIIKDILQYSYNQILQIFNEGIEILIPASEEIIEEINVGKKLVKISAPEGLIEIYSK